MRTQCSQTELDFGSSGGRKLVGAFDRRRDQRRTAACCCWQPPTSGSGSASDWRAASATTATPTSLRTRPSTYYARGYSVSGLGHEDLIDHDVLRFDPALMAALDKPEDALAGKSTLNRLEHAGKIGRDRHHKLDHDTAAIERLFVDVFMDAHEEPPIRIVLDLDATDDRLFGFQEGRQLPRLLRLLLLLAALHLLRSSPARSQAQIVERRRRARRHRRGRAHRRPDPRALAEREHRDPRRDSGFCRDELMTWCEENSVKYVLGLAGNSRLHRRILRESRKAKLKSKRRENLSACSPTSNIAHATAGARSGA